MSNWGEALPFEYQCKRATSMEKRSRNSPDNANALSSSERKQLLHDLKEIRKGMSRDSREKVADWARTRNDVSDLINCHHRFRPGFSTEQGEPRLQLVGTVSMEHGNADYEIPLIIQLGPCYPIHYPSIFIPSGSKLKITPGHARVDDDGKVYLEYLHAWNRSSNLLDLVKELSAEFAIRPLVYTHPSPEPAPAFVHEKVNDPASGFCSAVTSNCPVESETRGSDFPDRALKNKQTRLENKITCPISKTIMKDPVVAADGQTYDREAIEGWWMQHGGASPLTGRKAPHFSLKPDHELRSQILEYRLLMH